MNRKITPKPAALERKFSNEIQNERPQQRPGVAVNEFIQQGMRPTRRLVVVRSERVNLLRQQGSEYCPGAGNGTRNLDPASHRMSDISIPQHLILNTLTAAVNKDSCSILFAITALCRASVTMHMAQVEHRGELALMTAASRARAEAML